MADIPVSPIVKPLVAMLRQQEQEIARLHAKLDAISAKLSMIFPDEMDDGEDVYIPAETPQAHVAPKQPGPKPHVAAAAEAAPAAPATPSCEESDTPEDLYFDQFEKDGENTPPYAFTAYASEIDEFPYLVQFDSPTSGRLTLNPAPNIVGVVFNDLSMLKSVSSYEDPGEAFNYFSAQVEVLTPGKVKVEGDKVIVTQKMNIKLTM